MVLDASVVIAIAQGEPLAPHVTESLELHGCMSSVNVVETCEVLDRMGSGGDPAEFLDDLALLVRPLSRQAATRAGEVLCVGRPLGLSLADACCIATAEELDVVAVTTDRAWLDLPEPWRSRIDYARAD